MTQLVNVPLPLDLEPLAAAGTLPLEVAGEHVAAGLSVGLCGRCLVGAHTRCRQSAQTAAHGPGEAWRCVCPCRVENGPQNGAQR